jgi:hypothetical protein
MNEEKKTTLNNGRAEFGVVIFLVIIGAVLYDFREDIIDFLKPIVFFTLGIIFLLIFLITLLGKNPFRGTFRRFKKWHIVTRIIAYFAKRKRLSKAVENIDLLEEIETKVEDKSLTRMAYELKEAEKDYDQAIKHCNGSKAAERAVKEAYIQRCARINEKYKT